MSDSRVLVAPHRQMRAASLWLLAGLMTIVLSVPDVLLAQAPGGPKSKGARGAPGGPPGGMMPGMPGGMMPGMPGGMMPGMPGANAKTKKKKKGAKADEEETDPEKLPLGYVVPPEPPTWLKTDDEWQFDPFAVEENLPEEKKKKAEDKKRRDALSRYKDLLSKGEFTSDADKEKRLISDVIQWKLAQMTRREHEYREAAYKRREELFKDLREPSSQKVTKRDVRKYAMQVVAEHAPKLFNYHLVARLNGAILLADMSELNEADADGRNAAVRCTRAAQPLINVLDQVDAEKHKQPEVVRVWAVIGLVRIASAPEVKPVLKNQIVDSLVKNMAESVQDHEWLQMRLAEALGSLGVVYSSSDKRPYVPQVLAEVMVDGRRSYAVRAEAAQSLGRLPLDRDIDLSLLANQIAHLAEQMAEAYRRDPERASWKLNFIKLYLAFKPGNEEDATRGRGLLTQVESKAALAAHKATVQGAFGVVLPLVENVLSPGKGVEEPLTSLKSWLKSNPVRATRISDSEKPIISEQSPDVAPAGGASTSAG